MQTSEVDIYDVGLEVDVSGNTELDLSISSITEFDEDGINGQITLISRDSEEWIREGRDELTLVRLSGLPNEIVPSIGVKDILGDWLFTWSDLVESEGTILLTSVADWSGTVNGQIMLSQVQQDGSLLASELKTFLIDAKPVADEPLMRVKTARVKEDTAIKLTDIVITLESQDRDSSEIVHLELKDPLKGLNILNSEGVNISEHYRDNDKFIIRADEINNLYLIGPEH